MKKIYYCKNLFDNIIINNEKIKIPHCALSDTNCALNAHKTFHTYEEYLNHFFNRKKGAIKQLFLGKKPIKCEYCSKLESQEINIIDYLKIKFQKNFITSISIFLKKKEENKNPSFEKLLKYLIQKNMIKKEKTVIEFFEYNIESWDEIKDVIETSYKYGIKKYTYTTNAEIFIPEIAEYGKDTNSTIIIPLNAGCRETYQKTNNWD